MNNERRYEQMCSDRGMRFRTEDGESVVVRIDVEGVVSLTSTLDPDHGGFGSFNVHGLDPQIAASKKKSFWRGLWKAIKGAVAGVVDAVTVPLFGYRCRPDINISLNPKSITLGISCNEA